MFCSILSAAISGVDAVPVHVEADVSDGMPYFTMVGYVSSQVREAQDRVRTALRNLGISLPPKRITINLAPGNLRKDGTRFDLPIAAGIMEAVGFIDGKMLENAMLIGELHLDGTIERVTGILPSVIAAKAFGCSICIVPLENVTEAKQVRDIRIVGMSRLEDLISYCQNRYECPDTARMDIEPRQTHIDFCDIHGQETVKRAALISAAGFHNLLLSGPPGSGKSMAAERLTTILPEMTEEERLEVSKIYSIVGLLPENNPVMRNRPFRAPHHSITATALCGGGVYPRPGEVTLAHRGVLFLDELPEMNAGTIEMLRQPLESREITISRLGGTITYPASFLLVAAMNPCPCGYYMSTNHPCICSERDVRNYQARISQALLDRMDLRCDVPSANYEELTADSSKGQTSAEMRRAVVKAGIVQKDRYRNLGIYFNSELSAADIRKYCPVTDEGQRMLQMAFDKLGLSARGYHHTIRVARTIADLEEEEVICEHHISEALCFRCREDKSVDQIIPGGANG